MEIAVISGKGGTGKSSISAAFATLSNNILLADCDVDAANMYLIFDPYIEQEENFISGKKATIDYSICSSCGYCMENCRFDAISFDGSKIVISEVLCDGCKLCAHICPANAITMVNSDKSKIFIGSFRNGRMVYGKLAPGEENSGKLVNVVREKAKILAKQENIETIIIDGPPGIGCPVLSTITGVDYVIIVTEPTLSGLHDIKRTIDIVKNYNLKFLVIINKYDLNEEISNQIEIFCKAQNMTDIYKLPFDKEVVDAMVNCKSIIEYNPNSSISKKIIEIFDKIKAISSSK